MSTMEGWFNVVSDTQGFKGVLSSRYILICCGSVNISRAGDQLVGKSSVEEEVKNNILCQEEEYSLPQEDSQAWDKSA